MQDVFDPPQSPSGCLGWTVLLGMFMFLAGTLAILIKAALR